MSLCMNIHWVKPSSFSAIWTLVFRILLCTDVSKSALLPVSKPYATFVEFWNFLFKAMKISTVINGIIIVLVLCYCNTERNG